MDPSCVAGVNEYTCDRCGIKRGDNLPPVKPHSFKVLISDTANCTSSGERTLKCESCDKTTQEYSPAKGHDFSVLIKQDDPKCEKEGSVEYKCSKCTETRGDTLPALQHQWKETSRTKPTEEKEGAIIQTCSLCGKTETTVVPKLTSETEPVKETDPEKETGSSATDLGQLSVDPGTLIFSNNQEQRTVKLRNVSKDSSIKVSISPEDNEWIKAGKNGENTYSVVVLKNTTNNSRNGVVTFTDTANGRTTTLAIQQSNAKTCTISFIVNGGRGQQHLQSKTVVQNTSMKGVLPENVDAPAFKMFDGWYTAADGGIKYTENSVAPSVERLTLYAHWTNRTYYIEFDGNGAESGSMPKVLATCNTNSPIPENAFIKTGYMVDYWTTNPDGSGTKISAINGKAYNLVGPYAEPGKSAVLYAHWIETEEVELTLEANGGAFRQGHSTSGTMTKTVIYKTPIGELPAVEGTPGGKVFDGWEDEYGNPVTKDTLVMYKPKYTIRVKWKTKDYTIHFEGNGNITGTMADLTFEVGAGRTLPECAFDNGVKFDCWGTRPDGTGENFAVGTSIDSYINQNNLKNVTLYALWYEKQYSIVYHDGFTGETMFSDPKEQVVHAYRTPNAVYIPNLTFAGWTEEWQGGEVLPLVENGCYTSDQLLMKAGSNTILQMPPKHANTIQVYSIYERNDKNAYSVIYHPYQGSGGPGIVNYTSAGVKKLSDEHPTLNDHVFYQWTKYPESYPITEVTLTNENKCVVVYADWFRPDAFVILNPGFDAKPEIVPLIFEGENDYTLRALKHDDYTFKGWKTNDGKLYHAGDTVHVSPEGLELTAEWEKNKYRLRFYDSYNGALLGEQYDESSAVINGKGRDIPGMKLENWFCYIEGAPRHKVAVDTNEQLSDFVDMKSENGSGIVYILTTNYVIDPSAQQLVVFYDLNGGYDPSGKLEADPTYGDIATGSFTVSQNVPKRDGCEFDGWISKVEVYRRGYDGNISAGETVTVRNIMDYEVTLTAQWRSQYSLALNMNGYPNVSIPSLNLNILPGDTLDLGIYYKKYIKIIDGYTFNGWGTRRDVAEFAKDEKIKVPAANTTIYAVFAKDEFYIQYCDAYSGVQYEFKKMTVGETLTLPNTAPPVSGYELSGWKVTTKGTLYGEFSKGEQIIIDRDLVIYPIYERIPTDEKAFSVTYISNGGTGGPGSVQVKPGEYTIDLTNVPYWPGHTFRGWDEYNQNELIMLSPMEPKYPVGKECKIEGKAGEQLTLYAVWIEDKHNELKTELEAIYGDGSIEDSNFYHPYTSSEWEPINNTTYYVVHTERSGGSQASNDYFSKAFVMEYKNGEWLLKAYNTDESIKESMVNDILTSHTNTSAVALEFMINIADVAADIGIDAVCAYIPAVGYVIKGTNYLEKAVELIHASDDYDSALDFFYATLEKEAIDYTKDQFDSKMLGTALENISDVTEIPEETLGNILNLSNAVISSIKNEIESDYDGFDPYGAYDKAFSVFKERLKGQGFGSQAELIPIPINNIYRYVNNT